VLNEPLMPEFEAETGPEKLAVHEGNWSWRRQSHCSSAALAPVARTAAENRNLFMATVP